MVDVYVNVVNGANVRSRNGVMDDNCKVSIAVMIRILPEV